MKTFGLIVPKSSGSVFEGHVRDLLATIEGLEQIVLPLLDAWKMLRSRIAGLSKLLISSARKSE